ncbi:MAG: mechanosensitive ion channel family protein [Acidobacteriota bacterium]|nr:mechanosensitive ion channel family protein [Acidobacteriota bacterium]
MFHYYELLFYSHFGLSKELSRIAAYLTLGFLLVLIGFVVKVIMSGYIMRMVSSLVKRTRNTWDDILFDQHVFEKLSHLGPGIVFYVGADLFPAIEIVELLHRGAMVYITVVTVIFINSLLNAVMTIYQRHEMAAQRPIKGYVQAVKMVAMLIAAIFIVSTLVDKPPQMLLGTLGAFAAVLMLVFKDPILGFVAGIQLAANNLIRKGDWLSMPQAGADGDVIDVTLTNVMVQNWNKTITSIPIYHMVSQPFTNWRGMSESGGRRIKRALHLDMNSIRFCDRDLLERFRKIEILKNYLEGKLEEINEERGTRGLTDDDLINGRQLTNIGTFRAYISAYLTQHPMIHDEQDMTFLVRQLEPSEKGLPIEIYVFSKDQAWVNYENIQSDIFDHLLAVVPLFELRLFQQPSGNDLKYLQQPAGSDLTPLTGSMEP